MWVQRESQLPSHFSIHINRGMVPMTHPMCNSKRHYFHIFWVGTIYLLGGLGWGDSKQGSWQGFSLFERVERKEGDLGKRIQNLTLLVGSGTQSLLTFFLILLLTKPFHWVVSLEFFRDSGYKGKMESSWIGSRNPFRFHGSTSSQMPF